jgi:hypothetical protein
MDKNISTIEDVYELLKQNHQLEEKFQFIHHTKTEGKAKKLSLGRIWFNLLLPDDFELIDRPIKKPDLSQILKQIREKYDLEQAIEYISKIQNEAFKLATICPSSFTADSIELPEELVKEREELDKKIHKLTPEEYEKELDKLNEKLLEYLKEKNIPIENVLQGKVKGDRKGMWKTLLLAKGYVVDIEDNVLGPINKGVSDGLNPQEYYLAAKEARRLYYYKTVAVRDPGYLSRQITMANAQIQLGSNDCKTNKYFELYVTEKLANRIIGRYYKDGNKLAKIESPDQVVNKTIKLRSPLYCKEPDNNICKICYGELAKKLDTKNIGILSGGAINNVTVNAMMKMKHASSQIKVKRVNFPEILKEKNISKMQYTPFLDVQETKIFAKQPVSIYIDKGDYDDDDYIDTGDTILIPGFLDVYYKDQIVVSLPIPFTVIVHKPADIEEDTSKISLNYEKGDLIIEKTFYSTQFDPKIIKRLFGAKCHYIRTPEELVLQLANNLEGIDLIHFEVVVQNMFRDADDETLLARYSKNRYKNSRMYSQIKLPFINSWLTGLAFQNPKKAIQNGLVKRQTVKLTDLDKVVLDQSFEEGS